MDVNEYGNLLRHMEWADARVWGAILSVPELAQDKWMREWLYHYHSTQWAYLQIFRGDAIHLPEFESLSDVRSVGAWARRLYRELPAYSDGLDEAKLKRVVEFPFAARVAERFGSAGPATVGESIVQLALHTAHHRGQVVMRLRQSGGEPPMTDFIAWVWLLRPTAQWGDLDAA